MQARYSEVLGGRVLRIFGEVGTGLRKKEGGGAAGRDVVLSKYFSSERSAALAGGRGCRQMKAPN